MHIEILSLTNEEIQIRDYCDAMQIRINDKDVFSVYDGEPEDNNLSRNFNDCFKLAEILKMVFNAGANGESLILEEKLVDEI